MSEVYQNIKNEILHHKHEYADVAGGRTMIREIIEREYYSTGRITLTEYTELKEMLNTLWL